MITAAARRSRRLFGRTDEAESIKPGAQYRRRRIDATIETAQVQRVYLDPVGIPHVRYSLMIEHPSHKAFNEGQRVLSISAFFEQFPEPCAA